MQINRATPWGIVVADVVVIILLLYLSDYVVDYLWLLFLQFFVVVVILRKSLRIIKIDLDEKKLTNWKAVGVGALLGIIPAFLVFSYYSLVFDAFDGLVFSFLLGIPMGIPGGIIGALIGRKWKKTISATQVGAVFGTLAGIGGWFLALKLFDIHLDIVQ